MVTQDFRVQYENRSCFFFWSAKIALKTSQVVQNAFLMPFLLFSNSLTQFVLTLVPMDNMWWSTLQKITKNVKNVFRIVFRVLTLKHALNASLIRFCFLFQIHSLHL